MSDFSIDSISAFMAIGKRYTVDIKLHGMGISTVLLQIDELSFEEFMDRFDKSKDDIIRTVNAFFGTSIYSDTLQVSQIAAVDNMSDVIYSIRASHFAKTDVEATIDSKLLERDKSALQVLRYALDKQSHESAFEAFQAIAWFVNTVNRESVCNVK